MLDQYYYFRTYTRVFPDKKNPYLTRGSLFIAVTTHELDEGRRLHSLTIVLKDIGFVIDTNEERGDFTFMEGLKI